MTDISAAGSANVSTPAASPRLLGRLGSNARAGVGHAGCGRTLLAFIVSFIYFFPVLWIILTAFKTYEDALAVPAKFLFTPTLANFSQVFSRAYSSGGKAQDTGFSLYFFNSIFISGTSVVLALVPTKGITLPFISYGGTSLFFTLASIGVLLNLSRETD